MSIATEYLTKHDTVVDAAAALARDLMRGDAAELKLGYSIGSALIAVAETFDLATVSAIAAVAERLVNATHEHYSATQRPLVIVNITGGVEQWTIALSGLGTPDVHIFDFDDEADLDDQQRTLDRWIEVIALADGRVTSDVMAAMLEIRDDLRERLDDLREREAPGRYR